MTENLLNPNHPRKGQSTKIEPIRLLDDIKRIKELLSTYQNKRNLALFIIGINTNLRASDLCRFTVGIVKDVYPSSKIYIIEKKTSKCRSVIINPASYGAINMLLNQIYDKYGRQIYDDFPLFVSAKHNSDGTYKAITPIHIHALVKSWCAILRIKGNYGSHTLRKTWGYHQRVTYNVDIPTLMVCFNHSNQRQTLDYLCIDEEEVMKAFSNEL